METSNNSVNLTPAITSNILKSLRESIIQRFVEVSQKELEAARLTNRMDLVDSLPLFIDNISACLAHGTTEELSHESTEIGKEHGLERAKLAQYDLNSVIVEYRILVKIIFDMIRKTSNGLDVNSEIIILDTVHRGIANSATMFQDARN